MLFTIFSLAISLLLFFLRRALAPLLVEGDSFVTFVICYITFWRLRRPLAASTLSVAVRISGEAFLFIMKGKNFLDK